MIPDEMLVYEPHHVGYARYGAKWYRIIANYGGGNLVLHPHPAAPEDVEHKFCKSGCKRTRFVRKEKWLLRRRDPDEKDDPKPVTPPRPPLSGRVCRVLAAVLAGFCIGVATMSVLYKPATQPIEIARSVPKMGALHQHDKRWWKVEDVFPEEELAKGSKRLVIYQAHLRSGKPVAPFNFTPADDKQEKTVYLVLTPAHPPLGMIAKAAPGAGPILVPPASPQQNLGEFKKGPLAPPKGQWQ